MESAEGSSGSRWYNACGIVVVSGLRSKFKLSTEGRNWTVPPLGVRLGRLVSKFFAFPAAARDWGFVNPQGCGPLPGSRAFAEPAAVFALSLRGVSRRIALGSLR